MLADDMMCYAVVYNILAIGEAAYHLTKAFKREHPETEWEGIMRMSNVLAHDYFKLKLQTVWEVLEHDLHPLREQVARYLDEVDWEKWENILFTKHQEDFMGCLSIPQKCNTI